MSKPVKCGGAVATVHLDRNKVILEFEFPDRYAAILFHDGLLAQIKKTGNFSINASDASIKKDANA